MNLLTRLLGRKKQTSAILADEISNQQAAIAASRSLIEAAKVQRKAAIEAFDDDAHRAADETMAAANRDIERRQHAIGVLEAAHRDQVASETRETFRREVAAAAEAAKALSTRVREEYAPAARTLGKLAADLRHAAIVRTALDKRGRELGETVDYDGPEAFRRDEPQRWTVSWPNPEGGVIRGPIETAPQGSISWINGQPVSRRDDVKVYDPRGGAKTLSLSLTIGDLPGLHYGDDPFNVGRPNPLGGPSGK